MSNESTKLVLWLLSNDTGMSSKNIVRRFLNLPIERSLSQPYDAADFARCYRLLKSCPFIDISIMKNVDKIWRDLVGKWQEITRLYEKKQYKQIYHLINTIDKKYRKGCMLSYSDIKLS